MAEDPATGTARPRRQPKPAPRPVVQAAPIFVDATAAAEALSISERTLQYLVATGELSPPRRISAGRVGYLWADLLAFAESRPASAMLPPGKRSGQAGGA